MWSEALFYPAAQAVGMLVLARATIAACPGKEHSGWVDFRRPDVTVVEIGQSTDHAMRFQSADFPELDEADEVVIEHVKDDPDSCALYRVRKAPYVPDEGTGFEKIAILTKVA